HVLPRETCEEAGWKGTVGIIHSHPGGERCFYYFPGTQVASSDAESFERQPYPVDAIMCGDSIVWISRDKTQRQVRLAAGPIPIAADQRPGNRVHTGSLLTARGERQRSDRRFGRASGARLPPRPRRYMARRRPAGTEPQGRQR